jgi:hypothetical protein
VALVTDLTERATERREPGHGDDLPEPDEQQPADPPSALSGGVELTRLIVLARLTPSQALEIGASVLAESARRPEPDIGSPGSDRVMIDQVVIGADGRVTLGPAADGGHDGGPPAVGPTGLAVEALLADVAGAARLRGRHADPTTEQLLAELDRAVTELPVAGVPAVARTLQEAAAAIDRRAVRAELAALVRTVGRTAGSASVAAPAAHPSPVVRVAPGRRASSEEIRPTMRRIGAWLLSVLVLAAVVVLEVALLRDHIATDIGLLLDAGRSGSEPSAAPQSDGLPIVPPAPAAAGSVTAVDLRPLSSCAPGAPCTLRLLVRLVPGADPQVVTWSYRIVHRCTGITDTAPGGSVTVPARGEQAAAVGTVPLPAVQAVAVVAVTDKPAAAAAPPVLLGSCLSDRQPG